MKKNLRHSSIFTYSKWFFAEKPIIYILLLTYLFITLLPLVWVLSTSFKSNEEAISLPPQFIPNNPTFENYLFVITEPHT
jgi:ABC-type glycerol-3-phosphate transport system permease component